MKTSEEARKTFENNILKMPGQELTLESTDGYVIDAMSYTNIKWRVEKKNDDAETDRLMKMSLEEALDAVLIPGRMWDVTNIYLNLW